MGQQIGEPAGAPLVHAIIQLEQAPRADRRLIKNRNLNMYVNEAQMLASVHTRKGVSHLGGQRFSPFTWARQYLLLKNSFRWWGFATVGTAIYQLLRVLAPPTRSEQLAIELRACL